MKSCLGKTMLTSNFERKKLLAFKIEGTCNFRNIKAHKTKTFVLDDLLNAILSHNLEDIIKQ